MRRWLVLALAVVLFAHSALASDHPDHVIVNSQDWRDVYSGMQYGQLVGSPANFLVSTRHSTILLFSIPTTRNDVLVLSSRDRPFVAGYPAILRSRGYDNPEEIRAANMNLELLGLLTGVDKFIVMDDAYGYNAISVAPYAAQSRAYVIFANRDNIDSILPVLRTKSPSEVLIYGQVDRQVRDALAEFTPEILNRGNRFENNIEIVRRYQEIRPTRQVILTNGEFIEAGIMSGADPVLFLGRQNVPDVVRDFIREGEIDVGILIGNELVNSATFVRRQLGISVFVKFAQGARQPTGSISTVEDLDRFPMPSYEVGLEVTSMVYNRALGALEVTYRNTQDLALYFKSTITLRDGPSIVILGDENPVFLDKSEYKTLLYRTDIDGNPLTLQGETLGGDIFVVYGEAANSLEHTYQRSFEVDVIELLDDANIDIIDLYYDTLGDRFFVTLENIGATAAYVSVELVEILVNDERITVGGDGVAHVQPGKKARIPVLVEMEQEDLEANPTVLVRAYYGERELSRIKVIEKRFPMVVRTGTGRILLIGAALLVIAMLLFFLATKKKCRHCGHKNPRGRKTCEKCKHRF